VNKVHFAGALLENYQPTGGYEKLFAYADDCLLPYQQFSLVLLVASLNRFGKKASAGASDVILAYSNCYPLAARNSFHLIGSRSFDCDTVFLPQQTAIPLLVRRIGGKRPMHDYHHDDGGLVVGFASGGAVVELELGRLR